MLPVPSDSDRFDQMGFKEVPDMQQRRNRVQWVYAAKNNQELQTRYDQWAHEYDKDLAEQFEWLGPRTAVALFAKHVPADAKVLDAGAGTGLVGEQLVASGFRNLHGIDLSPRMLEVARRKGIYRDLQQMTLGERLAFATDTFDAVISVGVFTMGHAPAHAFDELARITKPGGSIVFSLRPELYDQGGFRETLADLEAADRWCLAECSEPYHPLPKGEPEVVHRIWVYRVTA